MIGEFKIRSFKHWTFQYLINRTKLFIFEQLHPDLPWLTASSIHILSSWLKQDYKGFEWGSGRSTIWFSKRVKELISVEHNREWFERISKSLEKNKITNLEYHLIQCDEKRDLCTSPYVAIINEYSDSTFDFIIVDGILRDYCSLAALPKLRPTGMLIIDNINWYFPSKSISPGSKKIGDDYDSEVWAEVAKSLMSWRVVWTTNGVTDTALFFKPAGAEKV